MSTPIPRFARLRQYWHFCRTDRSKNAGFTMLELVVVIMLIAILIFLILAYRPSARRASQDNTRKADLQKIKIAAESYANDNECYPSPQLLSQCGSDALAPYLAKVPCDPATDQPYLYIRAADCLSFSVYTTLEREDDPESASLGCENGCGPDLDGDTIPDFNFGANSGRQGFGEVVDSGEVSPTCPDSQGNMECIPNGSDGSCCPGGNYRCNSVGDACLPI